MAYCVLILLKFKFSKHIFITCVLFQMEMLAVHHLALTALNEARSDDAASLAACGGYLKIKNYPTLRIILFQSLMLQKRLGLK